MGSYLLKQAAISGVGPPNATVGTGATEETIRATGLKSAVAWAVVTRVARKARMKKSILRDFIVFLIGNLTSVVVVSNWFTYRRER